jgi:hypothetical protein
MLGAMNFITTILNMRYEINLHTTTQYLREMITHVGNSIVGPLAPVKRGNRLHKSIFPLTSCTDLVV